MPKVPFWVFILVAIIYFTAIRVDTMDIDASQYAEISREMMKSGDYLHVYDRGIDYLDKPPFLFWVSAASMKVFGVNNFGYKLPSLLFALLALFATYRLARLFYNEAAARMSALVLATSQGMFLMANDIRCDTILMSWVITAVWLIQEWVNSRKLLYLLGGAAATAFGMMTKGPIALMVPVFCFVSDWILKRQWKTFFQPAYILAVVVIALLLIPMSIGLYQQFDLHPEKVMDGKSHVSGLRFFYWSQSFGRITGESPWKNDVNIGFLLQNMLWSFLPWIFLFVPAVLINTVALVKQKFRLQPQQEWVTTGGFVITYLALGSSAYQLPHYIFVVYPLASIVTAKLLHDIIEEKKYRQFYKIMHPFQVVISSLILFTSLLLIVWVFPQPFWVVAIWGTCFAAWLFIAFRKGLTGKIFWITAGTMIFVNLFLTNNVYYALLKYQVGSQAGRYLHENNIAGKQISVYNVPDPLNSIQFYAQDNIHGIAALSQITNEKYLLTADSGYTELSRNHMAFEIMKQGQFFKVSELTPGFLNPATRDKEVRTYYIVKLR